MVLFGRFRQRTESVPVQGDQSRPNPDSPRQITAKIEYYLEEYIDHLHTNGVHDTTGYEGALRDLRAGTMAQGDRAKWNKWADDLMKETMSKPAKLMEFVRVEK